MFYSSPLILTPTFSSSSISKSRASFVIFGTNGISASSSSIIVGSSVSAIDWSSPYASLLPPSLTLIISNTPTSTS